METTQRKAGVAEGMEYLIEVSQKLSLARTFAEVSAITRRAARELCGADGATFVLREGDLCYYADEDAITPLWKGRRFPIEACVSGWSMLHRQPALVEDIYNDPRVPVDAYATTFVRSLVLVPIRESDPIGAIGNYWSTPGAPAEECVRLLRALANLTGIAIENVRLLESLQRANAVLEDSLRSRDEFISIAAHELRTPLSSLKLQLQLLDRKLSAAEAPGEAPKFASATSLSLQQTDRLHHLVENLLDVSSIRLERVTLHKSPVDLGSIVEALLARQRISLERAGMKVESVIEPGLRGSWDALRLEQILSNLTSNAMKYAPRSSLAITAKPEAGCAVVIVEDGGPGIPEAAREKIFERFARASADERVSGLGLGLYVAKNLAEAHGGRFLLEPGGTRGARFRLELPLLTNN